MPFDLRDFLASLEGNGELVRVAAEVDPVLEMTEVYDRVVKGAGPALLFEHPRGSTVPLLINALGTDRRMEIALGRGPDEIGREAASLLKPKPPRTLGEMWRFATKYRKLLRVPPKRVRRAPCQEVVMRGDAVDLSRLPVQQCWPGDAGRFITLPLVFTKDPETSERNVGMYRMQVLDPTTTAMHWQTHKHGRAHFEKARTMGLERLPVSVAIGGDPALIYAATAPLPPAIDELLLTGFIRGERTRIVKCVTNDLEVPASAEIVLEGYVDTRAPFVTEGPFGDHTGFYSLADKFPAFHVTAITTRRDPIYASTVVGVPPHEDAAIGRATEHMFRHLVRFQVPELVDFHMPVEAAFHNLMIASLAKQYPGHARKLMMSLWGAGMLALEKVIVVVDASVDVRDPDALLRALRAFDPARDLFVVHDVPTDTLDHAAPRADLGSHVGIDLTTPLGSEEGRVVRDEGLITPSLERLQTAAPEILRVASWPENFLLLAIEKAKAGHARAVLDRIWARNIVTPRVTLVFDADVPIEDPRLALFHATANLDPARDIVVRGNAVGIDATRKWKDEDAREWPGLIEMDDATRAKVTARWSEYGLDARFRDVDTRGRRTTTLTTGK
ncbi:MAG: menaquinone biosynthesis decarboxylase [Thermoplasmatota archaeon]